MRTVALVFSLVTMAFAKYTTGSLSKVDDAFIFLDSFCFSTNINASANNPGTPGSLEYHIYESSASPDTPIQMHTFVDEFYSCHNLSSDPTEEEQAQNCRVWDWYYAYGTDGLSCSSIASHSDGGRNITNTSSALNTYFGDWSRPHYWFLAVANCEQIPITMKYTLTWLQPDGSQISYEDNMQIGIQWSFFTFYLLLSAALVVSNFFLTPEMGRQPLVRIFTLNVLLWFFGLFFMGIHWSVYKGNGYGVPFLSVLATIIFYFDRVMWMFLLILLAHGWSITRVALPDRRILFGILGALLVVFITLFFWQEFGVSAAKTPSLYASVPGGLYLAVVTALALYFSWTCWGTLKETVHAEKKTFFIIFGVGYACWFLSIPIVAAILSRVSPWVRDDVMTLVENLFLFFAHSMLAYLLWPARASKYFITTTQDMLLEDSKVGVGKSDYGAL